MSTAITVIDEVKTSLTRMQDQFAASLPKHINPERFIAVSQTALINKPDLLSLDRQSLYQSFMQAAQDGLMPDNKEAAIVPFKGKAKYMPMVSGICKKARNSGEIGTIDAQVVYEKDQYDSWVDEKGPHFKHVRARGDRGAAILTYAYAIGRDGSVFFEEIDEEQMQAIEKMARAIDSPWKGPFKDEMRRKSALRRLAKYRLPNSSDLNAVFEKDDDIYSDQSEERQDPQKQQETPSRLKNIIEEQQTTVTVAEEPKAEVTVTAQEAVRIANKIMSETTSSSSTSALVVSGQIEDIKVKDGEGKNGSWRRYAVKVGQNYYGTFDATIGERMQAACDSRSTVTIEYSEKKKGDKTFYEIVTFNYSGESQQDLDPEDVPI